MIDFANRKESSLSKRALGLVMKDSISKEAYEKYESISEISEFQAQQLRALVRYSTNRFLDFYVLNLIY